jgi:energy-coupling factor transporter ATP-binding protein EcfA2
VKLQEPILQISRVTVRRSGQEQPVLNDIQLTFHVGELVAICGRNGAGKTTLARALMGLCPLAKGEIVMAHRPTDKSLDSVGHTLDIQMVFQPPLAQLIGDTIFEELAMTASQRWPDWDLMQLTKVVVETCEQLGLHHLPPSMSVHQLSGGQLQRLCIAQALLSGARVLVFDEGLSALDLDARAHTRRLLQKLADETGATILMITHDMEDVLIADRVIVMEAGRVLLDDTPTTFFYDHSGTTSPCRAFGFEAPYVVRAAHAFNRTTGKTIKPCGENQFVEAVGHVDSI